MRIGRNKVEILSQKFALPTWAHYVHLGAMMANFGPIYAPWWLKLVPSWHHHSEIWTVVKPKKTFGTAMRKIDIRAWCTHELSHRVHLVPASRCQVIFVNRPHWAESWAERKRGLMPWLESLFRCELSGKTKGDATLKFHLPVPKVPSVLALISKAAFSRQAPIPPLDS